ncbi:MAG: hypothetical protein R3F49_02445 [Planctomycetota bacterium]
MSEQPRLHALLGSVRGRLVRQIWLHGLGTVALGAGAWLGLAYLADRWLHLPAPIRVFHGALLVLIPLWLARTQLARLLSRVPDEVGIAQLIERSNPAVESRLVSAVQLASLATDPTRGALVQRIQREAEALAAGIDVTQVFDPRSPRKRFLGGGLVAGLVGGALALQPALSGVFFQRMLGRDVSWPRRTTLVVELAPGSDDVRVEEVEGELRVRLARGSDLEVLVRAEGVAPESIDLEFEGGLREQVAGGGRSTYRTLLRSLQADTTFRVKGGDDRRGVPLVRVTVLQPPDVTGVAFKITPPRYTGLPTQVVTATEAEVLSGSAVEVHVLTDPANARGIARTFPDAREIPLVAMAWPGAAATPSRASGTGAEPGATTPEAAAEVLGLGFALQATESSRFRFELTDDTGLGNPDPGLFGIVVAPDRRPELTLIAPGQATLEVVAGGAVPLRLRVADDFGVERVAYIVRDARDEGEPLMAGELNRRPVSDSALLANGEARELLASTRIEVDALGGAAPLALGQSFMLTVVALDRREPTANEARTAPIALRVVSADDLLRGVREGLSRVGEDTDRLVRLVDTLGRSLEDAALALEGDALEPELATLGSIATDARRVQGDARGVARDLAELAARLLYARVDARATTLFERLHALLDASEERGFHEAPWRKLADEQRAGALGQAELGGELVTLVGLALDIAEPHAERLAGALQAARDARAPDDARKACAEARAEQRALAEAVERLRSRLGEWDDFQSILGLTKDLLGRQRNLEQRTRELSGKN